MAYSLLHHTKFLAGKAQQKQLVTFQQFADEFDIATLRSTTAPLNKILRWTKSKGLPPLNTIVVSAEIAESGCQQQDSQLQQSIDGVFAYPWEDIFLNLPSKPS